MRLNRIARGWYATEDGTWAVIGDDPDSVPTKAQVEESEAHAGILTGIAPQREWQLVRDPNGGLRESVHAGETIGWWDTKRDAVESLELWASMKREEANGA